MRSHRQERLTESVCATCDPRAGRYESSLRASLSCAYELCECPGANVNAPAKKS